MQLARGGRLFGSMRSELTPMSLVGLPLKPSIAVTGRRIIYGWRLLFIVQCAILRYEHIVAHIVAPPAYTLCTRALQDKIRWDPLADVMVARAP